MQANKYEMTDKQWLQICDLFPPKFTRGRKPKNYRDIFNALLWLARTGSPWRCLDSSYAPWQTVYYYFRKWRDDGTLLDIFEILNSTSDMKTLCIDSTLVKAHQHSSGAKKSKASQDIGDSRGGKTTKIHTITDEKGVPLCFKLTPGNKNDCTQAVAILKYLPLNRSNVLADKAYGTNEIMQYIKSQKSNFTIPPRSNINKPWDYDKQTYKKRNVIERFFNKVKHFRRVACRYDKLSVSFLAFVYIASIFIITK